MPSILMCPIYDRTMVKEGKHIEDIFSELSLGIDKENVKTLQEQINKNLSGLEKQVLKLYLKGKSYATIAQKLEKDEKSIDNAIQRIRKKIEKLQLIKC